MKSFFGFKDRAASAAKARVEWASSRVASATQKPPDFGRSSATSAPSSSSAAVSKTPEQAPPAASDGGSAQDVDPVLEHLIRNARSEAVRQEFLRGDMTELIDEYEIRLLVGTYNVNGRKPPPGLDLQPWLAAAVEVDVVVAGFQEIVPLNASNVMNDLVGGSGEAAFAWDRLIGEALNPTPVARSYSCEDGHLLAAPERSESGQQQDGGGRRQAAADAATAAADCASEGSDAEAGRDDAQDGTDTAGRAAPAEAFVQVAAKQMVGVYLSVWVRAGLLPHIRGVQATSVGTGIMGYLGNKGAVTARLRVFDTGLALVVAHLSSGEADGDELRRNYDYSEIMRRAAFPPDSAMSLDPDTLDQQQQPEGVSKVAAPGRRPGRWGAARGIADTEHCLWLGDLNYRLALPDAEARAALRKGDLAALAEADELSTMRRSGRAFEGWQEGPLSFPPTFKFVRGTMQYHGDGPGTDPASPRTAGGTEPNGDAAAAQKKRTPAWTDRVLWRSGAMKQLSYGSAELTASDHMPVAAVFSLPVREYNRERVEAAVEAARRRVDAAEMAAMPRCELEPSTADFGTLHYGQQAACDIVLRNVGSVTASFQFMPLPGAMFGEPADKAFRPTPRWASISPEQGVLEPGAATDLQLTAQVTGGPESTAEVLASVGRCKLEAILVLRIQDGNDIFLAASGAYAPSFFGLSLSTLADLPRPLSTAAGCAAAAEGLAPANGSLHVDTSSPQHTPAREHPGAGANAEFYSPTSSLNSPMSDLGEAPVRRKLDLSKLSQLAEAPEDDAGTHSDGGTEQADAAVAGAGGPQQQQQQEAGQQEADEGDQLAQLVRSAAAASESPTVLALVPPELRALTSYLRRPEVLQTPGLFINRADHMALEVAAESKIVREIREALDEGRPIPQRAGPHDVAATLLAFFASLPAVFMPPAAAQVCDVCVPSADAAASLLADAFAPVEWAVFRHVAGLMRAALEPDAAAANGLTPAALSALLADLWFGPTPHSYGGKGANMSAAEVEDLQRMAADITAIAERRAAFMALFLEPL